MVDNITRDIWSWAIRCDAHHKFETLSEMYQAYWKELLNSSDDSMQSDGYSEPLADWDYSSPQPGENLWDSN